MNKKIFFVVILVLVLIAALLSPLFDEGAAVAQPMVLISAVEVGDGPSQEELEFLLNGGTIIVKETPTSSYIPGEVLADQGDVEVSATKTVQFTVITLDELKVHILLSGEYFAYIDAYKEPNGGSFASYGLFTSSDLADYLVSQAGHTVSFFLVTGDRVEAKESVRQKCLQGFNFCITSD